MYEFEMRKEVSRTRPKRLKGARTVHYAERKNRQEEIMVNKIDATRMFWPIQEKINEMLSEVDITNEKQIKDVRRHVRAIKALMWDMWKNKELNEDIENDNLENSLYHLAEAAAQEAETEKKTTIELAGKDGGPLEVVRRLSKEDLDQLAPFRELLKNEQKQRLIPVEGSDRTA